VTFKKRERWEGVPVAGRGSELFAIVCGQKKNVPVTDD